MLQRNNNCYDKLQRARSRCERNFAIGIAGLAVSAFFTFGWGTVVGSGVMGSILIMCGNDATNDYIECLEDEEKES